MNAAIHMVFFIGTDAELIKTFPIIIEAKKRGIEYRIVASGQNDLNGSYILNHILKDSIDIELSKESSIVKTAPGLFRWFINTGMNAKKMIRSHLNCTANTIMLVHGDTVSTVMGSLVAKSMNLRLAHVEAGLRSFNWLNPFPEEIDRSIVSRKADIHFAPGNQAAENLYKARVKGMVVNTVGNTLEDSLRYAQAMECKDPNLEEFCKTRHAVMVMHRQENLQNKQLLKAFVEVAHLNNGVHKAIILHEPTRIALENSGLLKQLEEAPLVHLYPRVEYCDFMKLLGSSEYALTDGGSNQEELSYMGIPSLILRSHTERLDGLGVNERLFDGTKEDMLRFCLTYNEYRTKPITHQVSPSKIILDTLELAMSEA